MFGFKNQEEEVGEGQNEELSFDDEEKIDANKEGDSFEETFEDPTADSGDKKEAENIFDSSSEPFISPDSNTNTQPPAQTYTPPTPPPSAPSRSLNLGSGKFLYTSNECSVHQRADGSSKVHNSVRQGTRLWVEPSSSDEWVTVQRKTGPAYMRADCF